ncbi:hypothetical protein KHM83_19040 [Fusibacter paucivorans]|uniref:DUF4149 domain-containing protein n=1 Tax=Fusibacter paucivorans TaxID=76009 RepID=A0ABS5PVM1_9FIRM|nr:hypothetical protein [Fusibacter paucivorans]MBS7528766.1 hypothetical protein [Fusibacter paucivorans]
MKKNVYRIGFLLFIIRYIYTIANRMLFMHYSNVTDAETIQHIVRISSYLSLFISIGLILTLVIISILELSGAGARSVKIMAVVNVCLALFQMLISFGTPLYFNLIASGKMAIPLHDTTIGTFIARVSMINGVIKIITDIAILTMMILSYRSIAKRQEHVKLEGSY